MRYKTPEMELVKLETLQVICSSGLTDGSGDEFHEIGGVDDSTNTDGEW